jgi:Fungal Zn(2)-Cys(6) binuclear cluster domain
MLRLVKTPTLFLFHFCSTYVISDLALSSVDTLQGQPDLHHRAMPVRKHPRVSRKQSLPLLFLAPKPEPPFCADPSGGNEQENELLTLSHCSGIFRRSKSGCWTCRARKVKCDERRPVCMGCNRLDLNCDYSARYGLRDDTPRVVGHMQDLFIVESSIWDC